MTNSVIIAFLAAVCIAAKGALALKVDSSTLTGNSIKDLVFKDRVYVPYGPDLTDPNVDTTKQPWTGYGYGTGSTEHFAYDWKEGFLYSQSEVGAFITVIDMCSLPGTVSEFSLDLSEFDSECKDVVVCPEEGLLFMSMADANKVVMYETTKRDGSVGIPTFLKSIEVGDTPDAMKINDDCTILAVANQNEGRELLTAGAMTLITDFRGAGGPQVKPVKLTGFSDAELIANDVHLPMTQQGMKYWNGRKFGDDILDWTLIMSDDIYDPALFLDPEFIAFSDDNTEIYLNLQDNSAIARVDVATGTVLRIDGMGIKSWASNGIDLVKDDGCDIFVSDPLLYTTQTPDGIASVEVDGINYILTANEGSDLDFDAYEEKFDSNDVFDGDSLTTDLDGFIWAGGSTMEGLALHLNSECDEDVQAWCSDMEMTIGSSAVDYSNPEAPVLERVVGIGGRGMSILRVPTDSASPITMIWDSGDEFEKEGCKAFPWSHNALQDEEYAPVDGPYWLLDDGAREDIQEKNDPFEDGCEAEEGLKGLPGACPMSKTIDEKSPEDGMGVESVTVGVACSTLVAVACGENNGNCYLYDISNISSPTLLKVFNLSPASETANPGYAYEQRTLGEIDAESTLFVEAKYSPTGKDGIFFGGAISGTISFYEFECTSPIPAVERPVTCPASTSGDSSSLASDLEGLSQGAIAGIAIAIVVLIGIIAFIAYRSGKKADGIVVDTGKSGPEEPMA